MKFKFSRQSLEKNTQISNLMKIRPVGAELFHADGQTDMNLTGAPKNGHAVNDWLNKGRG
jgi:hypothetical protein